MMANIQQLIFDIIARDSASPAFAKLGATAQGAAGDVSDLSKRIDELGRRSAEARVGLAGDKEAQARLDKLDASLLTLTHRSANPNISIEGAARAAAEISALELQLDKLGSKSAPGATSALSGLAGTGGMGALIAAGVALSPVIITLGTGLAGLAVAGYSTISPILKAAQATGGLSANMHKLNPEQQQLAQSLLGTGSAYHQFAQQLQPEVFAVFNARIKLAGHLMHDIEPVTAAARTLASDVGKLCGPTDKAGASMHAAIAPAQTLAQQLQSVAAQTTAVMTAQQTALTTQLGYGSAILTSANDAQALRDKLSLSSGMIGLQTQKQRDSFGAAQAYIKDLGDQATQAFASGHGVDAAMTAIRNGLPLLDSAKTKNKQYWQEVQILVGWLDKLRQEKAISEAIHVSGTGVWSVTPGKIGLPGGTAGGPFPQAAGGMIRGGIPGRDSVLISAMPGEVVVPAGMVAAGLVDHLRGALPGFAGGGVVGSYAGNVAGLGPWAGGELNATAQAIAGSVAQALTAGVKAAIAGAGAGGAGVTRWAPLILQVLAMLGQSPANLGPVEHQIAQESGGSPRAINLTDINAQLGQPSQGLMQVIPPTFFAYAGPFLSRGIYDPLANIYAGLDYALNSPAYRGRSLASVMLQPGGYDSGGQLLPGATLAINPAGRAESVLGSRAEALLEQLVGLVDELCGLQAAGNQIGAAAPATTGASLGAALGAGARSATYRNLYP